MFRREFLKSLSLLGAGLTVSGFVSAASKNKTSLLIQTKLTGTITAGGKGLAAVAVTDGYTVFVTDKEGKYDFFAHPKAKFVYFSIPSGYKIPHQNSISQFYSAININQVNHSANFSLEKNADNDEKHGFVVWADTQIQTKRDAELLLANAAPDLKKLTNNYPSNYLHGIGCGDLVWDNFDLFPDYKSAISLSGLPFFNVIGNHDMDLNARSDEGSTQTFESHFGPTYYSFNRGKIHYVVLDDVFFVGTDKKYIGYLTENQLSWLEQDLKLVKEGSTLVVSLHIPTYTNQHKRDKEPEEMGGTVTNRKRLYDILKNYQVHIMSGHTHFNEVIIDKNITEHIHGTVCGAWWTGQICGDGTPNGYGVYEVDGDKISWYYKATGKEKDHQMRIYAAGKQKDYPNEVCINIWNFDKNWKINCLADGVAIGTPVQKTALDPLATESLLGKDLPSIRGWVEPKLTDHLFFITVPDKTRLFIVKATDGFGNNYSESIFFN
ncbi:calcineurin-like phosphoesterase C-terminal domain-containing protein [Pedobacter cryophilus]|uniref:Metallophosphoesterase n=1 Tax=Pedobacter cryophilus TaxID=2571271 RepID=A0A4U1C8G3_9SPHI|nr:calcineurin-like phosphoesterase family protein [Pedobacter cryophilus]TKC00717.1 metallophosphoesterase [Pedobacter cryophilus]